MSGENRTPTRQFDEVGDVHHSGESASERENNLQSQLLDRRMFFFSNEVERRINAIVAPLATQLETLTQPVRELSERSSNHSTEWNTAFERSRSSSQRSDTESALKNVKPLKQRC